MPSYIMLLRWTQKGVESVKQSPSRLAKAKEALQAAGGAVKVFYKTMGRYDAVVVCEAPDDATIARTALSLGAQGFIRTETMRAFSEDEFREIVADLP
ncbi:MAG TPA: GYD domain-containing protein [Acidobacteriota bacterium]|nr:GYD domain-containing protein [Acidobacteriota bacterium]